jgi:hypothetical protein
MVLQRVLDRILKLPPPPQIPAIPTNEGLNMAWWDAMPPNVAAQSDAEFMEWLSEDWIERI